MQIKKFESQGEVDEKRRKRQEEWEKVRKPDDPVEAPEEETRSLWQQLQDNQDAKNQEFDEQVKLRNSVKGLEDEEVKFLEHVSNRQVQLEKEREKEESVVLEQMREAAVKRVAEKSPPATETKKPAPSTSAPPVSTSKKSQQSLLLGAIKRKSTETSAEEPGKRKRSEDESTNGENDPSSSEPDPADKLLKLIDPNIPIAQVAGILPGIGFYGTDTSDSESSSAESDIDDYLRSRRVIVYKAHIQEN